MMFQLINYPYLYRTPLWLEMDDQSYHRKSYDLGYHHAKRGKNAEPDNPAIHDREAYLAGYNTSRKEMSSRAANQTSGQFVSDRESTSLSNRPEQDIEPAMRLPLHDVPKTVGQLASAIGSAGGRALLIGGAVRDKLMGKTPKDFDIEVYGMHPDKLEQELGKLGRVDAVGKAFGVLKIVIGDEDFDVSVPRRDSKAGVGHKGFLPVPDPTMTISEAARRRDFTMNTVAMDPHTGDLFDPYGGVDDIKNRVLKVTDPTAFAEDPLRILRGAQFAARFGLSVDPETMKLMQDSSAELPNLPVERVGTEWRKLLMKGEKPSLGMEVMKQSGALRALHPELDAMKETPQDAEWHPEGDVWIHTKMVTDRANEITKDMDPKMKEIVRYAALMHDIAKPGNTFTDENGRIKSPGHEEAGGKLIAQIFRQQFDVSKELAEKVGKIANEHLKPTMFYRDRNKLTDGAIRRLARRLHPATIKELIHTAHSDHTGRGKNGPQDFPAGPWLLQKAVELQVDKEPPKPLLLGRHLIQLGVRPGPQMGKILKKVFDMQVDGHVHDLEGATQAAREIVGEQNLKQESLYVRSPLNLI
jgi:tRNA nucleotidyltransferase (CCA-adding enzyme)